MSDFVQTFELDSEICDEILSNLEISKEKMSVMYTELPEIHETLEMCTKKYLKVIGEFNYFYENSKIVVKDTHFRYIPSWRFQHFENGKGEHFNFYIFLHDNESNFEIFNPFIRCNFSVRPRKGLIVIFPGVWMFLSRHTDTFDGRSIIISGTLNIEDFNDM